jgi:hypothetical protein
LFPSFQVAAEVLAKLATNATGSPAVSVSVAFALNQTGGEAEKLGSAGATETLLSSPAAW